IAAYPTDLAAEIRAYLADRGFLERIDPRPGGAAPADPPTRERSAASLADTTDLTFVPTAGPGVPPPPGRRLGDYELLQELGRGGMGVVYRARQRTVNRLVALKVIRADKLADLEPDERQRWVQRFHEEAQAVADLRHPHIVTLYEV